jgi:hypothetical protein
MSGLIWAGIGKGIADAGSTFGNYMAKDIESRMQSEREAQREERLLARQEALDRIKADREEAKAEALKQRVITESEAVGVKATEIGTRREGRAFDKLAESSAAAGEQGDVALSKEQLQKLAKDDPTLGEQYKKMGLIESSMPLTANQKRLQRAEDEAQAASDIGAHSSVIDAYSKKRDSVLAQIREENKVEADRRRDDRAAADRAASDRRFEALMPIRQQQADANTTKAGAAVTNANRPRASGGGSGGAGSSGDGLTLRGLQTEATAASRAVDAARKSRDKQQDVVAKSFGSGKEEAQNALAEANKKLANAEAYAEQVNQNISRFNSNRSGGAAAPKTSDNRPSTSGAPTKNYSNLWK